MNILLLTSILTVGIICIKAIWLRTEIRFAGERVNTEMIKTNSIEALILISQIVAALFTPLPEYPGKVIVTFIGILMYVMGFALAIWGRNTMKASWGIPGEHNQKKQAKLVTQGPFAFSRNPIYVGFLLLYFGFAIAIQSWLIILRIPLAIYLYRSAEREEKNLEKLFGKDYIDYKKRVPRFL
jgi:protein-S-isoprenylcysteine O-methyltransferase Ste14